MKERMMQSAGSIGAMVGAALLLTLGGAAGARADVIDTFVASGTFTDNATLGGTITIDTTTGAITSEALTISSLSGTVLNNVGQSGHDVYDSNSYFADVNAGGLFPLVDLYIDASGGSLVGYSGGFLYSDSQSGDDGGTTFYRTGPGYTDLQSGALTLQPSTAVPEPASLLLLPAGLAALAFVRRRRTG